MVASQRLTRADWTRAALAEMAENGLASVAVEPLAKKLGATKGSFYWHFQNRGELVEATLELWEREGTDAAIAALEALPAGEARLRRLFEALFLSDPGDRSAENTLAANPEDKALDLSIWLRPSRGEPDVTGAMTRVTERRVGYIAEQLVSAGVERGDARDRALLGYTAYLGFSMLSRSAPDSIPEAERAQRFVARILELILQEESQTNDR